MSLKKQKKSNWFIEDLHKNYKLMLSISSLLYEGRTKYQEIKIFENELLGKVLVLDDIIQLTEADEANYHEMMVHVPIFSSDVIEKILIIGGADGGILREVLKHSVGEVTLVDIDGEVIDICKEYLPAISREAFKNDRVEIIVDDGVKFLEKTAKEFNIIIVDSPDPYGPAESLFSENFYRDISKKLTSNGLAVFQGGVPFLQKKQFIKMNNDLSKSFNFYGFYFVTVPTYSGGAMALGWGSNSVDLKLSNFRKIENKIINSSFDFKYYNPSIHHGSFAIPEHLKEIMRQKK
ncbi:MAG: spermidine synthase [Rhodospirillaceae bacterium]|nr:spermidine synthase [Rhodospirillaceae bacterium]